MSIRAGASLPGPFFITFPVGGPLIGLVGLALAPFILMIWLMQAMFWLGLVIVRELVAPATAGAIDLTRAAIDEDRERQKTPSTRRGISQADRDLLQRLGM